MSSRTRRTVPERDKKPVIKGREGKDKEKEKQLLKNLVNKC